MALKKIDSNQYIKLSLDGTYKIYKSPQERNKEKNAVQFSQIALKYTTIINNLKQQKERIYYDPEFAALIAQWETEFNSYLTSHRNGQKNKNLALMKQYIKDIENTLPKILYVGKIGTYGAKSLAEVYEVAKRFEFFGKTEDC